MLRAPINGVILKRDVNPGQTVAVTLEAKTLFKMASDLGRMEVHARIDEADIGRVRPGQTVSFTVDAYPDQTFTGQVEQVRKSPEIAQSVVTYTAVISAPNPELLLFPGMTAVLRIVISETGEVLRIPNEALRFRPGQLSSIRTKALNNTGPSPVVWILGEDGRPAPIPVSVGLSDDTGTQLLEGSLSEGQPLIVGVANSQTAPSVFGIRMGFSTCPDLSMCTLRMFEALLSGTTTVRAVTDLSLSIQEGELSLFSAARVRASRH